MFDFFESLDSRKDVSFRDEKRSGCFFELIKLAQLTDEIADTSKKLMYIGDTAIPEAENNLKRIKETWHEMERMERCMLSDPMKLGYGWVLVKLGEIDIKENPEEFMKEALKLQSQLQEQIEYLDKRCMER